MRDVIVGTARFVHDALVELHAPLAGAALGIVLDALGTSGPTTILGALALTIALWVFAYLGVTSKRSQCQKQVAAAVRAILDRHLALTRIDAVGFGDYLTLRHLARAAEQGRLNKLVGFGGPAHTLERVLAELVAELEDEAGRCYLRLSSRGQARVDSFAANLRRACEAAAVMLHPPPYDPGDPQRLASDRVRKDLADAIIATVDAGNTLDRAFDANQSRATAEQRASSAAEKQRVEGHAAAVLLRSARDAAQTLQLPHVQGQVPMVEMTLLRERLARAAEQMREVEADAFREATDDARHAFRRIRHHDIDDALEASGRLALDPSDTQALAVLRHRLARFPRDLATLEAIRDGHAREVAAWPGSEDPDTPTLRPQVRPPTSP